MHPHCIVSRGEGLEMEFYYKYAFFFFFAAKARRNIYSFLFFLAREYQITSLLRHG